MTITFHDTNNYKNDLFSMKHILLKVNTASLPIQKKERKKKFEFEQSSRRCSVQSCLFVQSWPGVFLGQCRGNLCHVGAAVAANRLLSKNQPIQNKICGKVMFRRHCTVFFLVQCCLESLEHHCTRFLPMQFCPKSIKTTLNWAFSCAILFGASWATLYKGFTCAMLFQEY